MRKSSLFLTSLVAASALTVAWRAGEIRVLEANAIAMPGASTDNGASQSATPDPTSSALGPQANPTPTQTSNSGSSNGGKTKKPAVKAITKESDPIDYKYGTIQVSVTKKSAEITDVALLQGEATHGREKAYPILIEQTILAQGNNYGNLNGATFTTAAFKQAVENALNKF